MKYLVRIKFLGTNDFVDEELNSMKEVNDYINSFATAEQWFTEILIIEKGDDNH